MSAEFKITDYSGDVLIALDDKIYTGLIMCGIQAEKYAKEKCAVDTGRLRNSITHSVKTAPANKSFKWSKGKKSKRPAGAGVTSSNGGEEKHALYIGTNVEYAP